MPVDQSEEATRAAEYAAAVAAEYDAAVHAVHVLGEDVVRAIEQGVVDEDAVAEDSKAVTDTVSALAETADVPVTTSVAYGFSRTSKLRHPGSVVLDTAEELDADFIVVPREPVSATPARCSPRPPSTSSCTPASPCFRSESCLNPESLVVVAARRRPQPPSSSGGSASRMVISNSKLSASLVSKPTVW
ncbi:UspA domain-containing protein [Haloferax sp. BAB-2207]|nr:UspA domain-containing protein [Haloferax sp. BAB-2207]